MSKQSVFKEENQFPEEYKIPEIHQRVYLLNGECVAWDGPVDTVYSPICIPGPNGLERKVVGSIPKTTPKEAMEALKKAHSTADAANVLTTSMEIFNVKPTAGESA